MAHNGIPEAMHGLAFMYSKGFGINKDNDQALYWYKKAAEFGDLRAIKNLAAGYMEEQFGEIDYLRAINWLEKAKDAGDPDAINTLSTIYRMGLGVPVDKDKSLTLAHQAYTMGSKYAAYNLALHYSTSHTHQQSCQKAIAYALEAAKANICGANLVISDIYASGCLGRKDFVQTDLYKRIESISNCINSDYSVLRKGFHSRYTNPKPYIFDPWSGLNSLFDKLITM